MPGQLLAAFKAAAPRLGLSPRLVHAVDWLFRFTQPQDWGRGGRPIVWPSASMQQEALGLSATQVKAINRALIEAGVITMKDSPNGKRYGVRDRAGRITEAYGFDLSPIAARHAEFVRLAEEARAERAEMGRLRRRATIARKGIMQILETAAEYGLQGEEWAGLARDSRNLARALRTVERPAEMLLGVESLERRQRAARERLETLLFRRRKRASEAVDSDPLGPENRPHQYTYKPSPNPQADTVIAGEACSSPAGTTVPEPGNAGAAGRPAGDQTGEAGADRRDGAAAVDGRAGAAGAAAAGLPDDPGADLAGRGGRGRLAARRARGVEIPMGRGLPGDGPGGGGDRGGDRLGQAGGAFPVVAGRVFPRDGGEGEGRGAEPGADDLGVARGRPTGRGGASSGPRGRHRRREQKHLRFDPQSRRDTPRALSWLMRGAMAGYP